MIQLSFPQPAMLQARDLRRISEATQVGMSKAEIQHLADAIRAKLNPHPAHQKEENVPKEQGTEVPGMQHKYRETVLFFPSEVC